MATQVHGHQPVVIRQIGVHLAAPTQPTLRKPVNEEERASGTIAPVDDVELDAAAARHGYICERLPSACSQ
jgi:hypothetical protein